jgi:hypothetical protein
MIREPATGKKFIIMPSLCASLRNNNTHIYEGDSINLEQRNKNLPAIFN